LNAGGGAVWSTAPGATLSATLEPHLAIGQQDFSPAGQALRLDYTVNTGGYALWQTALRGAPSTGSLTFWAKGNSEIAPHLYLGDGERRARVALSDFVQLGPDWQWVSIPLEIFAAQGIDLTRLTTLDVVFEFATGQGVLWLDNIAMGPHGGLAVDQRTLYLRDGGERRVALRSSSGARWQATSDQPWLLAPGSGHGSADLRVRAVNWGLAPGEYRGAVTIINDAGASETIVVNLTVTVDGPPLHRVFMPAIQR
jgi:hypothetical protein